MDFVSIFLWPNSICFFLLKGINHIAEVIALLLVHTDGQLAIQISHCYRRIHANGSNLALCLQGLFPSCEENLNPCVSGGNKNIAILEALFYLKPCVF